MRKAYSYIRMSSEKQLKGDSLRRQLDLSAEYARENNLELVDNIHGIPLKDLGVSGFRGENSTKGVLSSFLQALDSGNIPANSVLLIESLDRLSREDITSALTQFLNIINSNIEIVTLLDRQRYSKETINSNQSQLFISLGAMLRANEESATKSKRLSAAWTNKRNHAGTKTLTKCAPSWLTYSDATNSFELIPERTKIVKEIFEMCANTCGLWSITRYLNQKKIPTFGKSVIWNRSYISKIIHNRAVIGELQPHKLVCSKRIPEGEPIKNYFPSVISESLFYLAQSAINGRMVNNKGPKGKVFSNLFTGISYCGICGSKMLLRNRGKLPKGGKTFICSNKYQGASCNMLDWRFNDVEQNIFKHLHDVEFSELLGSQSEITESVAILNSLNAQISEKKEQLENAVEYSISNSLADELKVIYISKINNIQLELSELKNKKNEVDAKLEALNSETQTLKTDDIKKVILKLEENNDDYLFRSSVNQLLTKVINRIEFIVDDAIYAPWEIDESDAAVAEFKILFPDFENVNHSKLVDSEKFKNFYLMFGKRIRIKYKSGAVRQILLGHNVSFNTAKARIKK